MGGNKYTWRAIAHTYKMEFYNVVLQSLLLRVLPRNVLTHRLQITYQTKLFELLVTKVISAFL